MRTLLNPETPQEFVTQRLLPRMAIILLAVAAALMQRCSYPDTPLPAAFPQKNYRFRV